ncbi:MAG: hypothetical protein SFY69_05460 [Planctomycetota bacterium]|nr:hypothetical protein [Planctomycetota bacterium]
MLYVSSIIKWIVCAPVLLLWRGYLLLWWAFDDSDRRRTEASGRAPHGAPPSPGVADDAPAGAEQRTAFEVVDSTPEPVPPPKGMLRVGFATTLAISAFAGLLVSVVDEPALTHGRAWLLWMMATVVGGIVTQSAVRHAAARAAIKKPLTRWGKVRLAAGGVRDTCVATGKGVGRLCMTGVQAARVTRQAARRAAGSSAARAARGAAVRAWGAVKPARASSGGAGTA